MDILVSLITVLFVCLVPFPVLKLCKKSRKMRSLGPVTVCYALGFLVSLLPIPYEKDLAQTAASVAVAVAIPLIVSGFDVRKIKNLAKSSLISFLLVIVSVIAVSSGFAVIAGYCGADEPAAMAGMATGLYIGGTPNLFAVGKALCKDLTTVNLANVSDSLFGGIYFMLVITVIRKVYLKFLGKRKEGSASADLPPEENFDEYAPLPKSGGGRAKLAGVFLLSVLCLAAGVLLEILINGNTDGSLYIMLTVSLLGVALSFIRPVRETEGSYPLGQYLVLVFSLGLGMSIDLGKLIGGILPTLLFFAGVQTVSLLLHFFLCKLFRIDGATALVTGIAGIYGPPFIAPVANSVKDRALILPGVILGTLGLTVGNLLGIGIGSLLGVFL